MVCLEEVQDNPGNFYICEYSLSGSFSGAFRRDLKSTWLTLFHRAKSQDQHCFHWWDGLCYCLPSKQNQKPNPTGDNAYGYVSYYLKAGRGFFGQYYRVGHYSLSSYLVPTWVFFLRWLQSLREFFISSVLSKSLLSNKLTTIPYPLSLSFFLLFSVRLFLGPVLGRGLFGIISHWECRQTFEDNVLLSCSEIQMVEVRVLLKTCFMKSDMPPLTTQVWGTEDYSYHHVKR